MNIEYTSLIDFIVCPLCQEPMRISISYCICDRGHQFRVINGTPDLLPEVKDSDILDEEEHWDNVAEKGRMSIMQTKYINAKVHEDYRLEFERCIKAGWPGMYPSYVRIADIGCGPGSAIVYFEKVGFQKVNNVGIDVSMKAMRRTSASGDLPPKNWKITFFRASPNIKLFKENSLDIVFSASALHHLELVSVIESLSESLKPNGLLILHEPNSSNIFAKIGRKLVSDFHTRGEKPISPNYISTYVGIILIINFVSMLNVIEY